MASIVLLGDSIFDNRSYTNGEPDVIDRLREILPMGWRGSLCALDGSTTEDIAAQLETVPPHATHLVMSVGGNDAMLRTYILDAPVRSTAEALALFAEVSRAFEAVYRRTVAGVLAKGLPTTLCTIYNGNFPEPEYREAVRVALLLFNDVILRVARENGLSVIDLRAVCDEAEDYANPIEPSTVGAAKIARRILESILLAEALPHQNTTFTVLL